jgi:hypothetical protein
LDEPICTLENLGPRWICITKSWGTQLDISDDRPRKRGEKNPRPADTNRYRITDVKSHQVVMKNIDRKEVVQFILTLGLAPNHLKRYIEDKYHLRKKYLIEIVQPTLPGISHQYQARFPDEV